MGDKHFEYQIKKLKEKYDIVADGEILPYRNVH